LNKRIRQLKAKIGEKWRVLTVLLIVFTASTLQAQQPAFPTAEGSGRFAMGGRGGDVYEVTNLSNSGPGSIVDAVSSGNRTIIFRLSGIIELGDVLLRPKSNTTIAGQTAPGDGICIKGRIYIGAVSNVVIRYIRVRVDAGAANSSGDAIDIDEGTNIIIDHVSASYARDEGISCQETSDKVTVQWCIISESLTFENHSYGSLIRGDYGDEKSYHHNLYAHNNNRMPRPGNYTATSIDSEGLHFDFRNNVVYNWQGSQPGYNADTYATSRYNFVGNVYITGPESSVQNKAFRESCIDAFGYFEDNSYNGVVPADQWSLVTFSGFDAAQITAYKTRSYLVPMEPVMTTSPAQAKEDVLASAGASIPRRDTIDSRIVSDVLLGTGHSIATTAEQPEGAWPVLNSLPAPVDDDYDGMPNDWELAHNLNPNDPTDRNSIDQDGYTQLEVYLNSLTGETVTHIDDIVAPHPEEFYLGQNYPNPFNPSTTINFSLQKSEHVQIMVFDQTGRLVKKLVDENKGKGKNSVVWDGRNDAGDLVSSGIYFCSLKAGTNKMIIRKMVVLK
jgi:pectate lyase